MNFQYVFGNPIPHKSGKKKVTKAVAKSKKPSKLSQVTKNKSSTADKILGKYLTPKSSKPKKKSKKKAVRKAIPVVSKRVAKVSPPKRRKIKKVKISAKQKTSARVSSKSKGKGSEVAKKKKSKSKKKASPKSKPKARRIKRRKAKGGGGGGTKKPPSRPAKKRTKKRYVRLPYAPQMNSTRKRRKKKGRKKLARRKKRSYLSSKGSRGLRAPGFGKTFRVKYRAKKGRRAGYARTKLRTNKRLYRNPIGGSMALSISNVLGISQQEALGLVGGGLVYGAANSLLAKTPVVSQVHAQLLKVPVIGASLPTLVLGALLIKFAKNDLMRQAGAGLVGASIVGIGVSASQMIPGLKPSMAGVDFTMNGVDFTLGDAQLGAADGRDDADFGQVNTSIPEGLQGFENNPADFGEDGADFGEIPEGLSGDGQLG
jgi:hypothetical protein